jgi:hypothetical protein
LSRIRTHDPTNQPAKTHASDRTATATGVVTFTKQKVANIVVFLQRCSPFFFVFSFIAQDF